MNDNTSSEAITRSDRILLRRFVEHDVDSYYRLGSNPEVVRFTGAPILESRDQAIQVLRERPLRDYQLYGFGRWAVVWIESQEVIGFAGPKYLPEYEIVDLGIWLMPEFWGKGIGTEATRAVITYSFSTLNLPSLVGLVDPLNVASQKMLVKSGLSFVKQFDYDSNLVLWYEITRS